MWWHKKALATLPAETTQDRRPLFADEVQKLQRAQSLVAQMDAHDKVNNYARRLRKAYALTAANEGHP